MAAPDTYQVIAYTPAWEAQAARLQTHLWGADVALNRAYLRWKYVENPYAPSPAVFLAVQDGEATGMRGAFGACWRVGEARLRLPVTADAVVHPDHRRRGILSRISEAMLETLAGAGFPAVVGLSASPEVRQSNEKNGWHSLGEWQAGLRPSDGGWRYPGRVERWALRRFAGAGAPQAGSPFAALEWNAARHTLRRPRSPLRLERCVQPAEMSGLEGEHSAGIRQARDEAYYAWRYANPFSAYRFLFWREAGAGGFMALQAAVQRPKPRLNIVEWAATDAGVLEKLLQAAAGWAGSLPLVFWHTRQDPALASILERAGLRLEMGSGGVARPAIMLRPLNEGGGDAAWLAAEPALLDFANWDLAGIDSDNY